MSKSVFSSNKSGKNIGTMQKSPTKADTPKEMTKEEQDYIEQRVLTRPIKFEPVVDEDGQVAPGGGLNVVVLAMHKMGKSIWDLLWGYYHSDYKDKMRDAGLTRVPELLSTGALPEIERIVVADTECTVKDDLARGKMALLLKPIRHKIHVVKTPLQRKIEGLSEDEKVVTLNKMDIDHQRQNIEAAIWHAVGENDDNTLICLDSASDYKKALDDLSDVVFKKTVLTTMKPAKKKGQSVRADMDSNAPFWRSFYQYRNKWWHNTLIKFRSAGGWTASTIKLGEIDDEYRVFVDPITKEEKMKPPYYPLMVKRTEYRIDQGYVLMDWMDMDTGKYNHVLRFEWGKHEHSVPSFEKLGGDENRQDECFIPYSYNSRLANMHLLEDMAPALLGELPEGMTEEDLW
jgi:hypothetical protein